ncbi:MAG: hypothetical protein WEA61_01950 [Anaerolineales bacterium]
MADSQQDKSAAILDEARKELSSLGYIIENDGLPWHALPLTSITASRDSLEVDDPVMVINKFEAFAIGFDLTWETGTAVGGCGLFLRSEDSTQERQQYLLYTLRLSSLWFIEIKGGKEEQDRLFSGSSQAIDVEQKGQNHYLFIFEPNRVNLHVNGVFLSSAEFRATPYVRIRYVAFDQYGATTCDFSNLWATAISKRPVGP